MSKKLADSLETGEHQKLNSIVGEWQGITKTWFGPDELADESQIKGTIKPLFDGRFVIHEYTSTFQGKELKGLAILGYHLQSRKFQCAWIDTFHMGTGIMFSEGKSKGNFYSVLGHYEASEEQPEQWGWRTEIDIISDNEIVLTAYNISPAGEELIATKTEYKRF
jgi:hypothetical protein